MNIIFGGAGFIGSNLARKLLEREEEVLVFDDLSLGSKENIEFLCTDSLVIGDINKSDDMERLSQIVQGCAPEFVTVWHFAANSDIVSGVNDGNIDFYKTFLTTKNILNFMKEHKLRRILFSSTSAVYGDKGDETINEESSNLHPISNYGAYKLASEAIISAAREDFLTEAIIFRFPNVVGTPATHGVILDFVLKLSANSSVLEVLGNGTQQKSYLYIDDLISAMLICRSKQHSERLPIFNIGNIDHGITVKYIAESVVKFVSPHAEIKYGEEPRGWKGDIPKFYYDVTKIQSIGWTPEFSSSEAVLKTIEKILKNE